MIAQAVTELENKTTHRQPPVLDRHTPFFRRILDRQIHNLPHRVICREHFTFINRGTDHAVQRFYRVRGVDDLTDIRRVAKECIKIFPVRTPAFTKLLIFTLPFAREHLQRHQRRLFGRSLINFLQAAGDGFVVLPGHVFQAITHHMDDAQLDMGLRVGASGVVQYGGLVL